MKKIIVGIIIVALIVLVIFLLNLFGFGIGKGNGNGNNNEGDNSNSISKEVVDEPETEPETEEMTEETEPTTEIIYEEVKVSGNGYLYNNSKYEVSDIETLVSEIKKSGQNISVNIIDDSASYKAYDSLKKALKDENIKYSEE